MYNMYLQYSHLCFCFLDDIKFSDPGEQRSVGTAQSSDVVKL